jgi:uncharacterized protein YjbI with pentapeptide repeats
MSPLFAWPFHPARPRICLVSAFVLLCAIAQVKPGCAADFSRTNLSGAHLTNADLRGSDLTGANLAGADLSGSDFRETNITQSQLNSACGDRTKLPAGLRIQPCRPGGNLARGSPRDAIPQAPDRETASLKLPTGVGPQ